MKITVVFDTLEEFQAYMGIETPNKAPQKAPETAQAPQEQPKAAEPKKNPKKDTAPAQKATEPDPEPQATAGPQQAEAPKQKDPEPEVNEDFRVEVRKTLAQLNKKVGKNVASELIKGYGVEKLTEVALADLPALMNEAKEALNAE